MIGLSKNEAIGLSHQVPGFAIGAVEAVAARPIVGAEQEAGAGGGDSDGDDEPGIVGDDVGGHEIDFGRVVRDDSMSGAAVCVDTVEAVEQSAGGLDLDAGESLSGVDDEVVTFAVAVGFGDCEAEAGGFEDECQFGEFSAPLGGGFLLTGGLWAGSLSASLRPPGF